MIFLKGQIVKSSQPKEHYQTRQQRRQEEFRRRATAQRRAARVKRFITPSLWVLFALVVVGLFVFVVVRNQGGPVNSAYPLVDGVSCDSGEHSDFHIHANLTIYIDGKQTALPAGIGIAPDNSCIYWLHTHNTDGMIHIEAPGGSPFTLKKFLDIWSGHFSQLGYPSELNQTTGWQVYVDGKPFTGDFHTIALHAHTVITLAYNSPGVHPNTNVNWNGL